MTKNKEGKITKSNKTIQKKQINKKTTNIPSSKKSDSTIKTKNNSKMDNINNNNPEKSICSKTNGCNYTKYAIIISIAIILTFAVTKLFYKTSSSTNPDSLNKENIQEIIAKWVEENPKLILESVINMQKNEEQQRVRQTEELYKNVKNKKSDLFSRKNDPVKNQINHDITIVEFFDYNCGYCKRAVKTLEDLINEDKKVKIVFKELPILGQSSEELTKASLAFNKVLPSKYFDFHRELIKSNSRTTEDAMKIAAKFGISADDLKKALLDYSDEIDSEIDFNRNLAASIGVSGTPAFIIGETVIPGAVGLDAIKEIISKERSK